MSSIPASPSGILPWLRFWRRREPAPQPHSVVDAPTDKDLLGYGPLAGAVARHILSLETRQTPLTIGIYGQWGSGKTSFLRMIDSELQSEGVRAIWFHAWKYEREDNLWAALIQTIVGQGTIGGSWRQKSVAKMKLAWRRVRLSAIAGELAGAVANIAARGLFIATCVYIIAMRDELADYFTLSGELAVIAPALAAVIAAVAGVVAAKPDALLGLFSAKIGIDVTRFTQAPSYRQHIAFLDDFTSELRSIIRIAGAGKPVVVVIDDLDRCLPEKALQVLEAMKLFLDVEGAVFLLAVDREVIQHAVAYKYRGAKELAATDAAAVAVQAESYLEKLIHLSFTLLPLGPNDVARLIRGVCDEETAQWADLFAATLPPNPRTVKRTLQMFLFMKELAAEKLDSKAISEPLLVKMIVMYEQCREIYRDLTRFPNLIEELETMARNPSHEIKDPALDERIKQLFARFPLLRELLVDETASFAGQDIGPYLELLRSVQRNAPPAPAPATPITPPIVPQVVPDQPAVDLPVRLKKEDGTIVPLDIQALLSESRIVLRGPRDSGKTSLLHTFAAQLNVRRSLEGTEPKTPLPIYLHLREVPKPVSVTAIIEAITRGAPLETIESGNCWVFFDGLAGSRAEPEIIEAIATVVATYPSNRYILATRAPGLDLPVRGFVYYDLVPPSQEELMKYLESQLGEGGKELAHQLVERGLATSPRLIRLAVGSARRGLESGDILEEFVAGTLDKLAEYRLEPIVARRLLIEMSRQTVSGSMLAEPEVLSLGRTLGLSTVDTLRYADTLSREDIGLLVMPRPGSYAFSHLAFHDFFMKMA